MKSAVLQALLIPTAFALAALDRFEIDYAHPIPHNNDIAWLATKNDCSIHARNVADGSILWIQHFCSGESNKHDTVVSGGGVYTFDNGSVKSWDVGVGMKWQVNVLSELNEPNDENPFVVHEPRIFAAETPSGTVLGAVVSKGNEEGLVLIDSMGKIIKSMSGHATISSRKLLDEAKRDPIKYAKVLGLVSSGDRMGVVTAYTGDVYVELHSVAYSDIKISSRDNGLVYEVVGTVALKTADTSRSEITHNTVKVWADKSSVYLIGIVKYASRSSLSSFNMDTGNGHEKQINLSALYYGMLWLDELTIDGLTDVGRVVRVAGQDGRFPTFYRTESLLIIGEDADGVVTFKKFSTGNEDDDVQTEALAYCPSMNVAIAANSESDGVTALTTYETSADDVTWTETKFEGQTALVLSANDGSSRGLPNFAHLVKCSIDSMTVVVTAQGGIAVGLHINKTGSSLIAIPLWSTENDVPKTGTDEL